MANRYIEYRVNCPACNGAKGLPCSNCAGSGLVAASTLRRAHLQSHEVYELVKKLHPDTIANLPDSLRRTAQTAARREAEHPHDWPYCAGDKPQRVITDTERVEHLRGVILKALDSWWPFVHGAVGASERARNLRKELADAIQPGAITDTQRLDFILSHQSSWYSGYYGGKWHKDTKLGTLCYGKDRAEIEGVTMRDAIDAAIRSEVAK